MVMPNRDAKLDGAAGADAVGGRRPTAGGAPAAPAPGLSDRPRRRTFTGQDKLRIAAEIDAAPASRAAATPHPLGAQLAQAKRENARLVRPLEHAEAIISSQKKVAALLGLPLATSDSDDAS